MSVLFEPAKATVLEIPVVQVARLHWLNGLQEA